MSILVLIESPGKLKKIQSFLGNDYEVMATCGHIRQLPKDELGFDIANNYEPTFEIIPDKADIVKKIKEKGKTARQVILAQDDDYEGFSQSWHCTEILKLPANKRYRATFTEITKKAITTAISNTLANNTLLDMNKVYSQFARMVLDKLIGYKISPLLWKEYNNWHLSAGRVQSCVVKLVSEREAEIASFVSEPVFRLDAKFLLDKKELSNARKTNKYLATTCEIDIKDQSQIEQLYASLKKTAIIDGVSDKVSDKVSNCDWIVSSIGKNPSKRNPSPPYITSSLQQDASSRLGMSPDACMKTAQKLYEAGLITYMRTDACFMAEDALKSIKIAVENKWGERYYRRVQYKTTSANAQEGHECIRPTNFSKESVLGIENMTLQHNRLYQLIWRRTVASQMAPADFEILTIKICNSNSNSNSTTHTTSATTATTATSATSITKKASKPKKKASILVQTEEIEPATVSMNETEQQGQDVIKTWVFVGKNEKLIFDGFLACMNLHKSTSKKKKTDVLGSNNANGEGVDEGVDEGVENGEEEDDQDNSHSDISSSSSSAYLEKIFSKIKEGDPAFPIAMNANQRMTRPPHARYTEASIIKKLDDLGIGRPSTYASMIKKVQEEQRQYVERTSLSAKKAQLTRISFTYPDIIQLNTEEVMLEGDKNKLIPTPLGIMINEYLEKNFIDIINYQFTAQVEGLLDEIASGTKIWHRVVDSVYVRLNPIIDQLSRAITSRKTATANAPAITDGNGNVILADTANRRLLGTNPTNGIPIYAIRSRKGFLVCESNPDKALCRFASFTGSFDTMTLEGALALLVFPRILGQYKNVDIVLKKAKNIYLAWNGKNYSIDSYMNRQVGIAGGGAEAIPEEHIDPASLELADAIKILQYYEMQETQRQANASLDRVLNADITLKKGPFGAYIKYKGTQNIKLPKALKERWETLTLEECLPVVENAGDAPATRGSARGRGRGRGTFRGRMRGRGGARGCGGAKGRGVSQ